MNTTTPAAVTLDLVAEILKNKTMPDCQGSKAPTKPHERSHGTSTSVLARNIYATVESLMTELAAMKKQHEEFHKCLLGPTGEHTCEKFSSRAAKLGNRIDALKDLQWQVLKEEFPAAFDTYSGVGLRNGWEFVSQAQEKGAKEKPEPAGTIKLEGTSITRNLVSRISEIILHPPQNVPCECIEEITPDENVICTITDPRIQALFALSLEIRNMLQTVLPPDAPIPGKDFMTDDAEEVFSTWLKSQSLANIDAIIKVTHEVKVAANVVQQLAWCAVRETLDVAPDSISLRKDWKIVADEEEDENPFSAHLGGAVVVPITGRNALLEALMRR